MRLAFVIVGLSWCLGCIAPSSTSPVVIGDKSIEQTNAFFATHEVVFEQLIGNNRREDVAVVVFGDVDCDNIEPDCETFAIGNHAVMEIVLDEPLFGGTRLGDYDVTGEAEWRAGIDGDVFIAQTGHVDLHSFDQSRELVASYDVVVADDVEVTGDVVASTCAALEDHLATCE